MGTTNETSMTYAKLKFITCIGALMSLACVSVLSARQVSGLEYALILSILAAALIFDFHSINRFFRIFDGKKARLNRVHDSLEFALEKTLKLPALLMALRIELLTLYYAFFAKFESDEAVDEDTFFSYSKLSNSRDVFLFVALSQLPFLPFIHVFVEHRKGPALAWVFTLLTLWSVIWYLAQVQAVRFRPIELDNDRLKYRFGMFWQAEIPLAQIVQARKRTWNDNVDNFDFFQSPLGSDKNVIIEFDRTIHFVGPYFMRKRKKKAVICVDRPDHFLHQLSLKGIDCPPEVK